MPNPANPQSLNRYSYVINNPLRYTDPTGHSCTEEDADGNIIHVNCGTGLPPNVGGGGNGGGGHDDDEDDLDGNTPQLSPDPIPPEGVASYDCSTYSPFCSAGALLLSIPLLPPSPFACQWVDCALSAASTILSGLTMTGVPEIVGPAFVADIVVTAIALVHTYDDYQQGEISGVTALALGGTGAAGLWPGPVGFAFSVGNTIVTVFGFPYP